MSRNTFHPNSAQEPFSSFVLREPKFTLDVDLIVPAETRNQLNECLAKIQHHQTIYVDWNFRSVDPLGIGTILNFYGPPGTGKTLAAEAFAGTLRRPFIQIGIAEIESKYMGETAKNIKRAFSEATSANGVLFFDEADTLLGKRLSSVTQGVDNEVNAMRSTMLIELEHFEGIVIFASNFAKNYDGAFRSRISYHVRFTLPDLEARRALWNRLLVREIPLAGERDELLACAAELTEGLSGREILTCIRLALPKSLLNTTKEKASVAIEDLKDSISRVKQAQIEVGSPVLCLGTENDTAVVKQLLGVK